MFRRTAGEKGKEGSKLRQHLDSKTLRGGKAWQIPGSAGRPMGLEQSALGRIAHEGWRSMLWQVTWALAGHVWEFRLSN